MIILRTRLTQQDVVVASGKLRRWTVERYCAYGLVMHHKRQKARNQRAGCKLCKPWKVNGYRTERAEGEKFSDHRRRDATKRDVLEVYASSG